MEYLSGKVVPHVFRSFVDEWRENSRTHIRAYERGEVSFVKNLLPEFAIKFSIYQTLDILYKKLGSNVFQQCFDPSHTVDTPLKYESNSDWLKTANIVGVNVRTAGSFWNVVNYAFTLPSSQSCIHLLPIWEPGVVGSLYGKVSWNINHEFFSWDLASVFPQLDNVEKQLKVVTNVLHALGKSVGLDVIPHTDRFSEIVIKHPSLFEWVKRDGTTIVSQSESLYLEIERIVWQYLQEKGTANGHLLPHDSGILFSPDNKEINDWQRQEIIFGYGWDRDKRLARRIDLIQRIIEEGYETLPMTMAPPYRGLTINPDVFVTDERGTKWYQYDFLKPQKMSRVFGPLVRYKFFHSKDDNARWELDFEKPNVPTWNYFVERYAECQAHYNFDFMRGDMTHIQMRPQGVPKVIDKYYDALKNVKKQIIDNGAKHFAFYAETFLAPPNEMGYGDELEHLEAIEADATLGDLQGSVVGSQDFMLKFANYDHWLRTRKFAPSFTIITADKDDPRFDIFYKVGNALRYFIGTFLTDMTSYMGLGFEIRNLHLHRGKNEEYSKLYVFQIHEDAEVDKVTHGPFVWGKNIDQFREITRIRGFAESIWPLIAERKISWLMPPDVSGVSKLIVWEVNDYVFLANLDTQHFTDIPSQIKKRIQDFCVCFDTQNADIQSLPKKLLPAEGLVLRKL